MRTKYRDARVAEVNCEKHFQNEQNYALFIDPGELADYKHGTEDDCIFFLGDDLSQHKFDGSKAQLEERLRSKGVTPELIQDLLDAFDDGYAYAMMYGS